MLVINNLDLLIAGKLSEDLTRKWTIKELATAIGKCYRPTYMAVQRLIKKGFIQKDAHYLISPYFRDTYLFEAAEKQRMKDMKNKEIVIAASRLEQGIADSFFSAILFGSSVRKKGNDIDILLIIPDSGDADKFRERAKKALGSVSPICDISCINEKSCYEMLNSPNELNVFNELMKNHLVLTGTETFYKIIRRWNHGQ